MNPQYQLHLDAAQKKSAENKKFLEKLKKKNPKDLDAVTNQLHEEAFENINCLECANCCKTTGPLLLNKDIERLAKEVRLKPAEFTQQYLRIDEDKDYVFKAMPCPFLGDDNYCKAYEARPNACREYPHTQQRNIQQKLKITYLNTLICPAVAKVAEGLKREYGN
ncbi:MAG: YkgJ family cysteine cluster protein [Bacteroidetes bacterium]|nr:YkgJ family cysteine cluster protein [Bacteroidota bacterium]